MSKIRFTNLEKCVSNIQNLELFCNAIINAVPYSFEAQKNSMQIEVLYLSFKKLAIPYRQMAYVCLRVNGVRLVLSCMVAGSHGSSWRLEFYNHSTEKSLLLRAGYQPILNDIFTNVIESNLDKLTQVLADATRLTVM